MGPPTDDGDPYATGFEYSRRDVLKTGTAVGAAAASAGCGGFLGGSGTQEETPTGETGTTAGTGTGTPGPAESMTLVDDDLSVVEGGFAPDSEGLGNFFGVRVRNDLGDETMSLVETTVQFFDEDLQFVEHRTATIGYLGPGEVFEGYLTHRSDEAAAYAIHATRSDRQGGREELTGLSVSDHSLEDERVRGTIENNGGRAVGRLAVQVAFFSRDGTRLDVGSDTITDLGRGEATGFEVELGEVLGESVDVADYSVSVGDYSSEVLSVR